MKEIKCNFCRTAPGRDRENPWEECRKCKGRRKILIPDENTELCGYCGGDAGDVEAPWSLCRVCNGDVYMPGLTLKPVGIQSILIQGGRPYNAYKEVEKIFGELKGDLCICDPYLGDETLDRLVQLENSQKVSFLTQRNQTTATVLNSFKTQFPRFEFRSINSVLHDRYILTFDSIIILGHGLRNIGDKDSFIIVLDNSVGEDLIAATQNLFNNNWGLASTI